MEEVIDYKAKIEQYLFEQEINKPVLIKLKTNENIMCIVRLNVEGKLTIVDPIFTAFSFYETSTHLSLMKFTHFSDERIFTIKEDSVLTMTNLSKETADMYARARAYVYDVPPTYIKDYLNNYAKLLEDGMLKVEEYAKEEEVPTAIIPDVNKMSEEDVDKLWQSALESPSLNGKKGN